MNILFTANIPSPYRVAFFNELGKLCNLTVTFEGQSAKGRNEKWKGEEYEHFTAVFLQGLQTASDQSFCPGILKVLRQKFDHIIVGGYSTPTAMLAIEYLRLHRIPFTIEADGGLIRADSGIKYKIKRHFLSSAQGWWSSGAATDQYLTHYGARPSHIYRYPFTSLHVGDILPQPPTAAEKKRLRAQLGMTEEKIVVSVGQFIFRKGFDVLLKAAGQISVGIGIYIIGDEPTPEYLQLCKKRQLTNVHFVGFQIKSELERYYKAADLFALPTREDIWGLVANEAMAKGLPIVTTDRCVAGQELVENGVNGYLVPAEDKTALAEKIQAVLANEEKRAAMARASLVKIQPYTLENMALIHRNTLEELQ